MSENLLDTIIGNHGSVSVVAEQHDLNAINFVAGLSDPGEMIRCGYLPQLRRLHGEQDKEYAERIRPLVMALPQSDRDKIMGAALKRANKDASTGKVAAMFARTPAWTGLGVTVSDCFTYEDVVKHCPQLCFTAELWESYAKDPANGYFKAPDCRHVVRTDTRFVLGSVGNKYHVLQPSECFAMMDGIVSEGLVKYETAGSLDSGRRIWLLARIPKVLKIKGTDEQIPYMLLTNTYDGSGAVRVGGNVTRVECQNTLNLALKDARGKKLESMSIRHTANMKGKVAEAREKLFVVTQQLDRFEQQANVLADVPMNEGQVREFYQEWYPTTVRPDILEQAVEATSVKSAVVKELLEAHYAESERIAKRNKGILDTILGHFEEDSTAGTAWACLNAGTNFVDHDQDFRGKTPEEKANSRMNNVTFGVGNDRKQEIFERVLTLAR